MINDPCKKCGTLILSDWRKDYLTIRTKELIYCSMHCTHNDRKTTRIRVDQQEKITHCLRCSAEITEDWRTDIYAKRYVVLKWCSKKCSNTRTPTTSTKDKIRQSIAKYRAEHLRPGSEKIERPAKECARCHVLFKHRSSNNESSTYCSTACKLHMSCVCAICNTVFTPRRTTLQKNCSEKCTNLGHSLRRQNYILNHGTFSTKRHSFTYKGTNVMVDSLLEKAGVIYMIDTLGATRVERYNNLINYRDGESHRTFNPDFICMINNKTHIVEVKQLWQGNQSHIYAKNIPLKREALKNYCDSKNFNMIWLDFNEAPDMRDIYIDVLDRNRVDASRQSSSTFEIEVDQNTAEHK